MLLYPSRKKVCEFTPSASSGTVVITDVQPVASYSWIEAATPTIAVPSSPGIWRSTTVTRINQDAGMTFIDQNAKRMKGFGSPLAPLFAAIDDMHGGGYDYSKIDIVSDRNNIRKLLRWATGTIDKDFRIDVRLAGNTCLFTRREKRDEERIVGFRGFGHEYEKAATRVPAGSEGATGHHRISAMTFGGKRILLRWEVDACTHAFASDSESNVDDLADALGGLSMGNKPAAAPNFGTIKVIQTPSRSMVPQSSLIELKTRVSHKSLDWAEIYPQLYLSQTAYLYVARHTKGVFSAAEKYALEGEGMKVHAARAEDGMGRLERVLDDIRNAVVDVGEGVDMRLVCESGELVLYRQEGSEEDSLEEEILSRFG